MRKIRFQDVEFRNFLSFGNTWQKFTFGDGLSIIQGHIVESEKSNGAGKSSLTELVPFALFGKTIKKVKKAEIINWYNGKNCEVRLKFTVDGVPHEIRRGIKPNKLDVYVEGDKLPQLASAVDYQNTIETDIIGMDFGTFQNLIYFSPNNTISIINAGKPEKRKFLESLFDLSVYSNMGKTTNGKLSANETKRSVIESEQTMLSNELTRLKDEMMNAVAPNLRKYRDKVGGLTLQIEALEEKKFDIEQLEVEREAEFLQRCKDVLAGWEEKNRKTVERFALNQTLVNNLGNTDDMREKIKSLIEQLQAVIKATVESNESFTPKQLEILIADKLQHKEIKKDELKDLINDIQGMEKTVAITESMIQNSMDNISVATDRKRATVGICDSCGQEVTDEILEEITNNQVLGFKLDKDTFERKLKDQTKALDSFKEQKDKLYEKVKEEASDIDTLRDIQEKNQKLEEERVKVQQRIDDLPDVEEIEKKRVEYEAILKEEKNNAIEQSGKIYMSELDIESSKERLDKLEEKWKHRVDHDKTIETKKFELKLALETYEEMQKVAKSFEKEQLLKQLRTEQIEIDAKKNLESLKKMNTLVDYLNYLKTSLKDENVKRFAISTLIPYLNQQANMYLSESGFPYVVTIDSWLDVSIRGLGVESVSYGSLSGGETKCIDMAVQLACNDIASMMAKTSLNLMVLDEVLDSSVDSLGVQSLLNIIRVRQTANNDCVYVITHRNEIDEFTFDSVVRIMNEDKFSTVEVV